MCSQAGAEKAIGKGQITHPANQGVQMLKKSGKFLADWRNEKGQRIRKAFPTKKSALAHQSKMQHARLQGSPRPTHRPRT